MLKAILKNRVVLAVFLLALAVRLFYVLGNPPGALAGDAVEYDAIGWNLASGSGFSMEPGIPTPVRAPGYPFFLAAVYLVFGHSPYAAVLLQALLGALCCLLVFDIGAAFLERRTAALGAGLYALYPVGAVYCGLLLSETLFTFFFLCSLSLFLRSGRGARPALLALAAFALGLATLTRPTTMLFPAAFVLALLPDWKRTLRGAVITAVFFSAALAPWALRNYRSFGVFMPVATGGSICLYATGEEAAGLTPSYDFSNALARRAALTAGGWRSGETEPNITADREIKADGLRMIKENPGAYFRLVLRRMPRYWFSSHSSVFGVDLPLGEYRARGEYLPVLFRLALIGLHFGLAALAVWGIALCRASFAGWSVLLLVLVYFNMHALFDMCPRYLVPVYPYLLVFCAVPLARLYDAFRPGAKAQL